MRLITFIVLLLLSFASSKSAIKPSTITEDPKNSSFFQNTIDSSADEQSNKANDENSEKPSVETLFIPEDPSGYAEILAYVRKLFEPADASTPEAKERNQDGGGKNESGEVSSENRNREETSAPGNAEDQFLKLQGPPRNSSCPTNEEKYPLKNPAENPARNGPENNGEAEKVSAKSNGGNRDDKEEIEADETEAKKETIDPEEDDLLEAANFGLRAMKELYFVKEPKLYSMGLYLGSDNPAKYVAAFNDQTDEARALAKYGFAVLQGATMFRKKFPEAPEDLTLSRQNLRNPLQRHCPNRGIPNCPPASLRYRTSDGSCNNLQHLWWGSAMSTMQRFLPPVYQDGIQSVRISRTGRPLPSARQVTNALHEDKDVPLASVTHMLMQWGQFVDHDLTATGQSRGFNGTIPQCCLNFGTGFQPPEFMHPECLPIAVSPQDSFFRPLGVRCLEFLRSGSAPKENCEFGPREQLTQVTSYLDGSTVYSSNALQADTLRIFRNGLLQYGKLQSQRPLLPRQDTDLCKRGSLSTSCFRAGDGRLSEQPALTSLHVVFLRLHNRISTKLAALNPHWSDEKLFQETRRIVGAVVQHITYREFLPIVLGQGVLKIFDLEVLKKDYYEGYDPTVNPTIANEFSTAAYRFGHSLVQRSFVRFDNLHQPFFNNVSIHEEFSNPSNLQTAGSVDRILLGLINQPSQRRDEYLTDELTNHLFQTSNFPFGMDLASLNIQRGRDHGIPPYIKWREPCSLSPIRSFEDLEKVMTPSTAQKFRSIYSSVEDIDLFSAGLAENSVVGGLVGPTFACIIGQQFRSLRKGDRFWYENPGGENSFTPGQLQQIRRVSLAQVLCKTVDHIETIQPFVFLMPDSLRNERLSCDHPAIGQLDLEFWAERAPQSRSKERFLDKLKKKTSQPKTTTAKPNTEDQSSFKINPGFLDKIESITQKLNPPKANVFQKNKIVVQKPLGPPDNVTIVVQNNAVNSPVFVSDAIYGSQIRLEPSYQTSTRPSSDFIVHRPVQQITVPPVSNFPSFVPPPKPIPTSLPPLGSVLVGRPYIPYAFNDPSNPNPLHHGYQSDYLTSDVVFESYAATSPRPTLYTYYTNYQRPITERPHQESEILGNYRPQYAQDQLIASPWSAHASLHESGGQLSSKPLYDSPGNQYAYNGIANWQKPQHWISQGYENGPNNQQINQQSHWNSQNDRYGPAGKPNVEIKAPDREYTTWSSVSSYKSRPIDENRPIYQVQPSRQPIQADPDGWSTIPAHQKRPSKPEFDNSAYQTQYPSKLSIIENKKGTADSSSKYSVVTPGPHDELKSVGYQRPVQTNLDWLAHQKVPTQSNYNQNQTYSTKFTGRPSINANNQKISDSSPKYTVKRPGPDESKTPDYLRPVQNGNKVDRLNSQGNQSHVASGKPSRDQVDKVDGSYQAVTQPKPSRIHGTPTETTKTMTQSGYKLDGIEGGVTSELPRPLVSQANKYSPIIRKPGQYYYEKNVLHRYPDKIEDLPSKWEQYANVEQRHKTLDDRGSMKDAVAGDSETKTQVNESQSNVNVSQTMGTEKIDLNSDDVNVDDLNADSMEEIDSVTSADRTNWVNPQEDASLASALEVPKIPSDKSTCAKELPKPIK